MVTEPPEDDFRRDSDPVKSRNAKVLGVGLAILLAAVAAGVGLTRGQPPSTATGALPTHSAPASLAPVAPSPTPVPGQPLLGSRYSATDDAATHQLVVFGGVDSYSTTWLWDGHRWSLAHPQASPSGRFGQAAAYDPLTRVVMVYGGRLAPGDIVNDTWAWDGATWRELDSGTGGPPAGEGSTMAWDAGRNQMILVNGQGQSTGSTWIWSGVRWLSQPGGAIPASTFFVSIAVDPISRELLAVSCCLLDQAAASTWAWDEAGWRRVNTHIQPSFIARFALDPVGGRILLCGDPALGGGREMWSWTGQDWNLLAGVRLPAFPESVVTDSRDGRLVILGSFDQPTQGAPQPVHLWSWNGSTWTRLG